ncbi:adenine-N(1)--methyltransferase [Sodiomyces alkalinus F11]|uniref:tRNA (adenine(58)-N(1))-methyltransferase catalytic subunit TRM61 n=1 Tax=Sodiomyces alkalinus (strain CBS 110278 / VKM F-3762 / F11) TaxID=1314773 RepID=A0A3N2PLY7_SODAK|nr:adenine-N(1)--methyltransferase [Sodiomyces alkalinus F11]ROT35545.1 adenine-N(1)--methyltransferase [Sodiomyces alkalinus F11]
MLSRVCQRSKVVESAVSGPLLQARYSSNVVQEHDVILLRQKGPKRFSRRSISPPIHPESTIKIGYGATVQGSDIIGKSLPNSVTDSKGKNVRLHELSLAQYVTNSPRVATPIYPQDATLIVSMLDLNLPVPGEDPVADAGPPVEIFEAGTGMGCLTLHLARAIHGANPAVPPELREALCAAPYAKGRLLRETATDASPDLGSMPHGLDLPSPDLQSQLETHLAGRRAIIQTLDINPSTSRQAHGVIRNFRRAQYLLDIDFHVSTIRSYLAPRLAQSGGEPFLAHAILDLPSATEHADLAIRALRPDGKLIVFTPSITQAIEAVVWAEESTQPVYMDRVIELPESTWAEGFHDSVGGREWDIRSVMPRKYARKSSGAGEDDDGGGGEGGAGGAGPGDEQAGSAEVEKSKKGMVCRPKVGNIVGGGGFLTVFTRRMARQEFDQSPPEESPASKGADDSLDMEVRSGAA